MRVGMGYDVHRLVEDRKLILGGVEIPYEKGLLGHSDADVLLHAIMDALLGAAASATSESISRTRIRHIKASPVSSFWSMWGSFWRSRITWWAISTPPSSPSARKWRPIFLRCGQMWRRLYRLKKARLTSRLLQKRASVLPGTGEGISSQAICALIPVANYAYEDVMQLPNGCPGCGGCQKAE